MKTFHDRVAVITGAASGFGKAFATLGAQHGMKLVLADVQQDALDAVVADLASQGVSVVGVRTDVSQAAEVQKLADTAMATFGQVHLLFNNAGVGANGRLWETSERQWEWVLGVNLHGVAHGVRIFTPLMLEAARQDPDYEGHIVNTASMAGLLNPPAMGVYNASKHAVVSLSETLFHELALSGQQQVNCSVLCPYFVPTGISNSERNRPAYLTDSQATTDAQQAQRGVVEEAFRTATVSAQDVAATTFEAIGRKAFYIYSHPERLPLVQQRFEHILAGTAPVLPAQGPAAPAAPTPAAVHG